MKYINILLMAGILFTYSSLKAQDVVIHKVFNSSSGTPVTGANDVIELLVIKDQLDMRGMYLKIGTSSLTHTAFGEYGRMMFADNDLWKNLRSGTTIKLMITPSGTVVEDLDGADRRIEIIAKRSGTAKNGYFVNINSAAGTGATFALSPYYLVTIKAANSKGSSNGAADDLDNLIHAYLPMLTDPIKDAWDALTGVDGTTSSVKKMAGTSALPTDGWYYATNPTKSLADFNGLQSSTNLILARGTGSPRYGQGEPGNNAAYVDYLRNAPTLESITTNTAPLSSSITFTVIFSKPVTGVDASDFMISTTGNSTGTISSITGSGTSYTVNLAITDRYAEGTIRLDKKASGTGITDGINPILEGFAFTNGDSYTVTDGRKSPIITAGQVFTITSLAPTGSVVGTVAATLDGPGAINNWEITLGNANDEFKIDPVTGVITVADNSTFDYNILPEYSVYVVASNDTKASAAVPVIIRLLQQPSTPVVLRAYNGMVTTLSPTLQGKVYDKTTITDFSSHQITLFLDGVELKSGIKANAAGVWTYTLTSPLSNGSHSFYIKVTKDGLTSDASETVTVLSSETEIAVRPYTILTPNNDGKNDTWKIDNIAAYPDNEVLVYNKQGQLIYSQINYQQDWRGNFNGQILNTGTYYYQIKLGSGKATIKGSLSIIREN